MGLGKWYKNLIISESIQQEYFHLLNNDHNRIYILSDKFYQRFPETKGDRDFEDTAFLGFRKKPNYFVLVSKCNVIGLSKYRWCWHKGRPCTSELVSLYRLIKLGPRHFYQPAEDIIHHLGSLFDDRDNMLELLTQTEHPRVHKGMQIQYSKGDFEVSNPEQFFEVVNKQKSV